MKSPAPFWAQKQEMQRHKATAELRLETEGLSNFDSEKQQLVFPTIQLLCAEVHQSESGGTAGKQV